jgi:putative proteasome-type protease
LTYCVALQVDEGIVFAADTRTNAGVDYVTSYSKLHTFRPAEDRVFVLLSAGSLATTRELLDQIGRDLDDAPNPPNGASLLTVRYVFEAAEYVGRINRMIQEKHGPALARTGVSGETSLILGGQIAGRPPEVLLVYPQGNYIGASAETPYLQIGETKYGKPILDRLAHPGLSVSQAATLALVSLDATVRSNVTVAAPFDFALFRRDQFLMPERIRLGADSLYHVQTRSAWQQGMEAMFGGLAPFPEAAPPAPPPPAPAPPI